MTTSVTQNLMTTNISGRWMSPGSPANQDTNREAIL
jgi:hypothetical protein